MAGQKRQSGGGKRASAPLRTAAMVALSLGTGLEAQERPSVAPKNMQAIAPGLADYTDKVLFGDVWVRAQLSPRDRSMVTLSVLIATGKAAQLGGHLGRGLNNGVTPAEVAGMVTHLAFYSGWPNAVSALNVIEQVFAERKIEMTPHRADPLADGPAPSADTDEAEKIAPKFAQLSQDVIFADLWRRTDLSPRDRSMVTIAAMAANGDTQDLPFYIERGLTHGLTREQMGEVFTHLAFYAGWPKARAAIDILAEQKRQDGPGLVVIPSGLSPTSAPATHFDGAASVTSPFSGTGEARLRGATVTFQKGARTHWHAHPLGQLLVITAGHGWVQAENEPLRQVRAGDIVWTGPGVRHWHGAAPSSPMTHVAISEMADGQSVLWLGPVSDGQ